jgi:hypothetical protein
MKRILAITVAAIVITNLILSLTIGERALAQGNHKDEPERRKNG